jgi:hypothetical protein
MNRRHVHRWVMWLLPLLLLRAFVPVGFMVSADASGLQLVICPVTTQFAPAATEHAAHHHHHADDGANAASAATSSDERSALCPFAVAGSACTHEIAFAATSSQPVAHEQRTEPLVLGASGPIRADRIRGPPILA